MSSNDFVDPLAAREGRVLFQPIRKQSPPEMLTANERVHTPKGTIVVHHEWSRDLELDSPVTAMIMVSNARNELIESMIK